MCKALAETINGASSALEDQGTPGLGTLEWVRLLESQLNGNPTPWLGQKYKRVSPL